MAGGRDVSGYQNLLASCQVGVAQGVSELVLSTRHQFASTDPASQQELERFGETGLALAVRPPNNSQVRGQVESLLGRTEGAVPLD